jgi:hypothetical protein
MAGGLNGAYSMEREAAIKGLSTPGYKINDNLFEFPFAYYFQHDFRKEYDGRVIKLVGEALLAKAQAGDKVAFMKRDWAEVRESMARVNGVRFNISRDEFDDYNERIIENLQKMGVDVFKIWFQGIAQSPEMWFSGLKKNGWPINVNAACAKVHSNKVRFIKVGEKVLQRAA